MKTYADIQGDGGSDIVGQVEQLGKKLSGNLAGISNVLAIVSGKGGVGKSTVTAHLAQAICGQGKTVGILDADINGSSITHLFDIGETPITIGDAVEPVVTTIGIRVMSIDLFLRNADRPVVWDAPTQKDAFAWRGLMEANALRELLGDTSWGKLDYLLIDLPPGADRISNIADILPRMDGIIFVTLPSGLSSVVVSRSMHYAKEYIDAPVLGIVENMSGFVCPACGSDIELFDGDTERISRHGDEVLSRIPFSRDLAPARVGEATGTPSVSRVIFDKLAVRIESLTGA